MAGSLAGSASTGDAEETLLVADLATPPAGAAGNGSLARGSAGAFAVLAGFVAAHIDLGFGAERSFLKLQGQIFAQIGATLGPGAATAAAAEQVAKAEEIAEDVAEILKDAGIETGCSGSGTDAGVSEAVIAGALLLVRQNGVGLAALLEFFLRVRVVGIAVGMVLHGQLAVSALDLGVGGRTADAQHFVVVAFPVRSQNCLPPVQFRVSSCKVPMSLPTPSRNLKLETSSYDFGLRATFTIAGRSRRSFNL